MHQESLSKYRPLWILFILGMALRLIFPTDLSAATEKNVLILHSNHQTNEWTDRINEGMLDILNHSGLKLDIHVEYLDSDRDLSKIPPNTLEEFFRDRYGKVIFDVILSSDNAALGFLMATRDRLFPGAPIVFCGINNFKKEMIQGQTGITGVNEDPDIKGTIDLALRLMPDIKRFFVIGDRTPTVQADRNKYEEVIKSFRSPPPFFELMDDFSLAELQERLQGLHRDSAILLLGLNQTRDTVQLSPREYMEKITSGCNVPVFQLKPVIEVDVLGGVMVTGKAQGASAASYALKILKGEEIDSLPVIMKSPNVTMVDFLQLKRFGIPHKNVPPDALILNEPESLFGEYWKQILSASLIVLLLVAVNIVLVTNLRLRKKNQKEIEHLKNHLANIIDSMPSMLVGIDNNEIITQWNRQVETATGIPTAEAVGSPIQRMFPDLSPQIEAMMTEIKRRRPATLEKIPVEEKGERHLYDLMLYPLISNGVEGAVLRIEDVTERSRIQELMIQTEKMMSLGGLAAGMAHEINNPLGTISQAAQNIERRVSAEIPANLAAAGEVGIDIAGMKAYFEKRGIFDFIGNIRDASLRASRIIRNILRFSRGTENIQKLTSPTFVLDQALELAESDYDLKKSYDFKSIEIVRDYAPDIPEVPMIAVEIEQVILNILKNAAQTMIGNPPNRKPRLTIRLRREDRYVRIEVGDNGPGMTEEVRRRVFEPFFTTKEPGIGTGLGLSVSYMIITQNHRGIMEAASTPGQGACFSVRLPLSREDIHEESLHRSGD